MPGRLDPKPIERRDFLGLAGLWAAGLAIFGSLLGLLRLPVPRVMPEASGKIRVGKPAEYPTGMVKTLKEHNVRVISTDAGIGAISLICTHLGCVVKEKENGFSCPCHGSVFGDAGEVVSGPAPRPLPWLTVSLSPDGSVIIDTKNEADPLSFYKV